MRGGRQAGNEAEGDLTKRSHMRILCAYGWDKGVGKAGVREVGDRFQIPLPATYPTKRTHIQKIYVYIVILCLHLCVSVRLAIQFVW